ncbi:MAG: hypothetical protein ABSC41_01360 [Acidimicrobiales bacterium]
MLDDPGSSLAVFRPHHDIGDLFGFVGKVPATGGTDGQQGTDLFTAFFPLRYLDTGDVTQRNPVSQTELSMTDQTVLDPEVPSMTAEFLVSTVVLAGHGKYDLDARRLLR